MTRLQQQIEQLPGSLGQAVSQADILPVEQSRDGLPVLRIDDVQLHSAFAPQRDAERFIQRWIEREQIADGDAVVMQGMGLGYYLEELSAALPNSTLQVLLPDPALLRTALEVRDLGSLLQEERITFHLQTATLDRTGRWKQLQLPAWKQLYSEQYQLWEQELTATGEQPVRTLRIQVVGPIHGGSLPIARSVASAFRELGHTVDLVDCAGFATARQQLEDSVTDTPHESYLLGRMVELLSDYVLVEVERFQPQLLVVLAQAPLTAAALQELKRNGIQTAYWFVEDYERITYWKAIAPLYDLFCTIQAGEFHRQLRKTGVAEPFYLPLAADPEQFYPLPASEVAPEYRSEISFVGAGYHNRELFFLGLYGEDFKIWGAEWNPRHPLWSCVQNEAERTDNGQNLQIFNGTAFNLNLHSSSYLAGVDPDGDFVNPRVFDIAAAAGFQLVDRRSLLPELFVDGKELIVYSGIEDLRSKLDYYREHPEERQAIAEAGHRRLLRDHTYTRRMEQLLDEAVRRCPDLYRRGEEQNSAVALRKELPEDNQWQQLLASYADNEELTLSSLDDDIRSRGELNNAEMVVMFAAEVERWARSKKLLPTAGGET